MQVIRTMGNDSAKIEVFVDGSVKYTYATPTGVEVFPVFVAGEYVMDGLRQA